MAAAVVRGEATARGTEGGVEGGREREGGRKREREMVWMWEELLFLKREISF
jgi:hypothetical protein